MMGNCQQKNNHCLIARNPPTFGYAHARVKKHLLDCEKTVRGVAPVWCLRDPKVLFGFISRPDAVEVLRNSLSQHSSGTFFFRLSNSEPAKLVLVYARKRISDKEVAPGVIKAVANNVCTRTETESCPVVQCSIKCKGCDVVCCISCAKICHDKHELSAVRPMKDLCCACKGCKIMKSVEELSKLSCWVSKCEQLAGAQGFCAMHNDRACEATPAQGEYTIEQMLVNSFSSLGQFSEFLLSHSDLQTVLSDSSKEEFTREELLSKFDDPYLASVCKQYSDFSASYTDPFGEMVPPAQWKKVSSRKPQEPDLFAVQKPKSPSKVIEAHRKKSETKTEDDAHKVYDSVSECGVGPSHYL